MTFLEKLYQLKNSIPMHMPGHKRNIKLAPYLEKLAADVDITEIADYDNLHSPEGIILEYMEKAKKLWNSKNSLFLINGSSCGVLAAVRSCVEYGDTVLLSRSCHKSVYHAIELCGLKSVYIREETDKYTAINLALKPDVVKSVLEKNPNIKLFIMTTPTYEGVISDIDEIAKICHSKNIPIILDAAHGAHLNFSDYFSQGVNLLSADIVIQSLHKTLPSLTQTAIAHVNSSLVDVEKFKRQLTIFQTSSPSYILLASICECVDLLSEKKDQLFENWEMNLKDFYKKCDSLENIKIMDFQELKQDKSKIIIDCSKSNITGFKLLEILKEKYFIDLEMAMDSYAIAMSSIADTKESLERLYEALKEIDEKLLKEKSKSFHANFDIISKLTISESLALKSEVVQLSKAYGRISAEYIWLYPPGIPWIVPGEIVQKEAIDKLVSLQKIGGNIGANTKEFPLKINVNITKG